MPARPLDPLDKCLIDLLGCDARQSDHDLAGRLGIPETTVRRRIERLQHDRKLAFAAITGFAMAGKKHFSIIDVQADLDRTREIARLIGEMPLIVAVLITTGRFNITAMCLVDQLRALTDLASNRILAIEGVHRVETLVATDTIKYDARLAGIVR